MSEETVERCARTAHEVNRAYCAGLGDHSQKPWPEAPEWQRQSAISGARFVVENPDAPASANHDKWLADKRTAGWVYGPIKDEVAKTHPCIVSFEELPMSQRAKDELFRSTVLGVASV